MSDDIEFLRVAEVPACPWSVGGDDCGDDALYKWEVGYMGRLYTVISCRHHARAIAAQFAHISKIAVSSGTYSQVSGIESTLQAQSPTPSVAIERVETPAVQEPLMLAVEAPRPTEPEPTQHEPLNEQQQQEAIARGMRRQEKIDLHKQRLALPRGFNPNDPRFVNGTHWFCATEIDGKPCGDIFLRGGEAQHGRYKKHDIPSYRLLLYPEGPLKCERQDHIAAGCVRTFTSNGGRSSHYGSTIIEPLTPSEKPPIGEVPFQRPATEDAARTTAEHRP